jgi:hypothetical protein
MTVTGIPDLAVALFASYADFLVARHSRKSVLGRARRRATSQCSI